MNIFKSRFKAATRKLNKILWWDNFVRKLTFGLLSLSKSVHKAEKSVQIACDEYNEYHNDIELCRNIRLRLADVNIVGTSISKTTPLLRIDAGGEDYGADWEDISKAAKERDNFSCQEISHECNGSLQVHHIVPLSRGGTNSIENLITLCEYHHMLKHPHLTRRR